MGWEARELLEEWIRPDSDAEEYIAYLEKEVEAQKARRLDAMKALRKQSETIDVYKRQVYTFKFVQNGDSDVSRTDYYVYENESMYKYDIDRLWLGDMPRVEGSFKGDGETRISLYPGEYLSLRYNGAEVARVGNVSERSNGYTAPTVSYTHLDVYKRQ